MSGLPSNEGAGGAADGPEVRPPEAPRPAAPVPLRTPHRVVITGGAGFLGCNLADRLARQGEEVLIYDNLSRPGVAENLAWLRERHGARIAAEIADIRDAAALTEAVRQASRLFHLAAQVAVTTSVADPVGDFEINLRGTLTLLEAARARPQPPLLVFASTNKVYGKLSGLTLTETETRHVPVDGTLRRHGIAETQPLDFYSPYGCSKGGADQYVLDYARIYRLPAAVFRMSCLYGPRQFGTEDQGWVAHFLISALAGRPINIYGDGRQVRDVLFIDDAVEAFLLAEANPLAVAGKAFNIGGGPGNAVSLIEVLRLIGRLTGTPPQVNFGTWRPGDQAWYVSDITRFATLTGWRPVVGVEAGLARLHAWLRGRERPAGSAAHRPVEGLPA